MDAPELKKTYNVSVALIVIMITIVATATYVYYNITTTQTNNTNKLTILEKDLIEKNTIILQKLEDEKLSTVSDKDRISQLESDVEDLKRKYWTGYRKRKELEQSIDSLN